MTGKVLVTANRDLGAQFFDTIQSEHILQFSLENYTSFISKEKEDALLNSLDTLTFIIHGNLLNAKYFVEWMNSQSLLATIQHRIHLTVDQLTADFLERKKIPAIVFRNTGNPIDVMEFMLRISKQGKSLYPTADGKTEEMPALLKELDMPVFEFPICKERSLAKEELKEFRDTVKKKPIEGILIHNRSALTRIKTALPDLNLADYKLISGSTGVTQKLHEEDLNPVIQAEGNWLYIADVVKEVLVGE